MNIEDLATASWEKIASLSFKELEEICSPFYHTTRPELVVKPSKAVTESRKQLQLNLTPQQQQALKLAEENGVDVALIMKSFAKKQK